MCTIASHEPGVMPVEWQLRNAMKVSPHGFGYAIRGPGRDGEPTMLMCKSLHGETMLEQFIALRERYPDDWAIFWARRATGTLVHIDNCQPLMVGGDNPETLFFHNGHFCNSADKRISDSRLMAHDIGHALDSGYHSLDGDYLPWLEANHIRPGGNKALIITSHPQWKQPVYMLNRLQWIDSDEGPVYSNSDFLGEGVGWADMELDGDIWRYRITQPGQCGNCGDMGHDDVACEADRSKTPLAWRNESENDRILADLARRYR